MTTANSAPSSLRQPPGLFLLFIVEMWERFSYYGMRGLLVLYLVTIIAAPDLKPGVHHTAIRIIDKTATDANLRAATDAENLAAANENRGPRELSPEVIAAATVAVTRDAYLAIKQPLPVIENSGALAAGSIQVVPTTAAKFNGDALELDERGKPRPVIYTLINRAADTVEYAAEIDWPLDRPVTVNLNGQTGAATGKLKPGESAEIAIAPSNFNSGRGWRESWASNLFGWYVGMAYLLPILGGFIADRFIGTHRSMVVGGLIIALGHIVLAVSGLGEWATDATGMSIFVFGLALIVMGTGHFKPCVTVMVGQLYPPGDPRRDGGFSIFYMGINLGAFICAFVCGTLGEKVGWHWGFGSAAVGMLLGLVIYLIGRPRFLANIGLPPAGRRNLAPLFAIGSIIAAAGVAMLFHRGALSQFDGAVNKFFGNGWYVLGLSAAIIGLIGWFVSIQKPGEKGPVLTIFAFILFNVFFWMAFEQAGSSLNLFAQDQTDRQFPMPAWITRACIEPGFPAHWLIWIGLGIVLCLPLLIWTTRQFTAKRSASTFAMPLGSFGLGALGLLLIALGILKPLDGLRWISKFSEVPTTWFQSVNPLLIILLAPLFAVAWSWLGRRNRNPSQAVKISLGLILLGAGYLFMVVGAKINFDTGARVSMIWLLLTYLFHTLGELCLSPTGLSFVTKTAPVRFVSLLMGVWFISSFMAGVAGGKVAALVEDIEKGKINLIWYDWFRLGGQADFFLLFVITSIGAGLIILMLAPLMNRLLHGREQ